MPASISLRGQLTMPSHYFKHTPLIAASLRMLLPAGSARGRFPPGAEPAPAFSSGNILRGSPSFRYCTPLIAASATLLLPKAQTFLSLCLLLSRTGAQQERGGIRKESLRGNLKGGERISRKAALLSLPLWFPLRVRAPRPGNINKGQKDKARIPKDYESACFVSCYFGSKV